MYPMMSNFTGRCTLPLNKCRQEVAIGSFLGGGNMLGMHDLQNLTRWLCPAGEPIWKTFLTSPTSEVWFVKLICTLVALIQLGNQPGGLLKRVCCHWTLALRRCRMISKWIGSFDAFIALIISYMGVSGTRWCKKCRKSVPLGATWSPQQPGSARLPCEVGLPGALLLVAPGLAVLTDGM